MTIFGIVKGLIEMHSTEVNPDISSTRVERDEIIGIRNFLNASIHPKYALMLNGEWGAGKTHIINCIIEESRSDNQNAIYISLNGMSSVEEISDAIYLELHPKLGGKTAKISKAVFFSIIKNGIKIDLNDALQISSGIDSGKKIKHPENEKDFIIVFDDLERCYVPIKELFGYINRYVENSALRVVVVANELELNSKGDYLILKEKTIADTITCTPDFSKAFDHFASEISSLATKSIILNQKEAIYNIFVEAKNSNLRIVRHSISKWHRFMFELDLISSQSIIDMLCYEFFAFAFEYYKNKSGILSKGGESSLTSLLHTKNDDAQIKTNESPFAKYSKIEKFGFHLPQELWLEYFDGKKITKTTIISHLKEAGYLGQNIKPLWLRAWDYLNCNTDEFNTFLSELQDYVFKYPRVKIGDYLHCVSAIFALISDSILNVSASEYANKIIDHVKTNRTIIDWQKSFRRYGTDDSAYNHIFNRAEDPVVSSLWV